MKEATEFWWLIVGIVAASVVAIWKSIRNLRRLSRMIDEFLGYDDHPGIPERVAALESKIAELERLMSIHLATTHGVQVNVAQTPPEAST